MAGIRIRNTSLEPVGDLLGFTVAPTLNNGMKMKGLGMKIRKIYAAILIMCKYE